MCECPRLPVIRLDAAGEELGVSREQAGRLDVHTKVDPGVELGEVASQHDPDLVGEDLLAFVVHDAAAVAVAVEAEPDIGPALPDGCRHGVQHLHVLGVRVVARESVVELRVERHDLAAERFEQLRREGPGRAVAAGRHHLQLAGDLRRFVSSPR
jgi:hypothetical protein